MLIKPGDGGHDWQLMTLPVPPLYNAKSEIVQCSKCGLVGLRDINDKGVIWVGKDYDTCDNVIVREIIT